VPSNVPKLTDPAVAAYFARCSGQISDFLFRLRGLVFDVAANTRGVGALSESCKWGEPSYAPQKPQVGSSVRLAAVGDGKVAVHFICHTGLVDRFREIYRGRFDYEGNRSIVLAPDSAFDEAALRHCVALALTYHLAKRAL
jgi:hypothetical protein